MIDDKRVLGLVDTVVSWFKTTSFRAKEGESYRDSVFRNGVIAGINAAKVNPWMFPSETVCEWPGAEKANEVNKNLKELIAKPENHATVYAVPVSDDYTIDDMRIAFVKSEAGQKLVNAGDVIMIWVNQADLIGKGIECLE